ncbi:MAG: LD-carboxypeptidase [Defluviitaleaceae bacterium]|nr:LD-carboxypeptidase [Defluviitaleaceae bacterium]
MKNCLLQPATLKNGDKVALIAPSSPPSCVSHVDFAVAYLQSLDFVVAEGASCRAAYGYLAGDDNLRANDVNWAFGDESIQGIFCLRGGYGTARILDKIDYNAIRRNPKFFCGYSDITALHTAINQKAGVMTFHTPMVGEKGFDAADAYTLKHMHKYIYKTDIRGKIKNPGGHRWEFLVPGMAEGVLCGGNLSVMVSLMGTAYEPDTAGKIIFIEEIGEKPYRIDRMLNQLHMAGKFDACAGVIFGDFADCAPNNPARSLTVKEIMQNLHFNVPVMYNFRCGHCLPTASLPMGATARLDSTLDTLIIL